MSILTKYQYQRLVADVRNLISTTRKKISEVAQNELAIAYWQIGRRIEREKLTNNSNYYASALADLSKEVEVDKSILRRTVIFFRTYPNGIGEKNNILTWSHYKSLITIKNEDLRLQLEDRAKSENWGRNKLIEAIKMHSEDDSKTSKSKVKRPINPNYLYKASIKRVIDGDTLLLDIDLGFQVIKEQRVRLNQIDAPELKTKKGVEASEYLKELASRLETVIVKTNKIDMYGRYLGDIFYPKVENEKRLTQIEIFENGIYLNEELVEKGFAKII
jgi:endonuclease YncB( thermonuclease family)